MPLTYRALLEPVPDCLLAKVLRSVDLELTSLLHLQVRQWQLNQQKNVFNTGYVLTMLGRPRHICNPAERISGPARGRAERAAINTPIQGSAADIATAAMLAIDNCPELKALGFELLLQVQSIPDNFCPSCILPFEASYLGHDASCQAHLSARVGVKRCLDPTNVKFLKQLKG